MNIHAENSLTSTTSPVYFPSRRLVGYVEKLEMFNLCSLDPMLSRMSFAALGVARSMSTAGIATFCAGQTLSGVSVLKIDPSGGFSA